MVDPGQSGPTVGEGLPPPGRGMLKELGLWDDFLAQGHTEAQHSKAAWGSPILQTNDFLLLGKGCGWTLDRPAFDRLLHARAAACVDEMITGRLQHLQATAAGEWQATVDGQAVQSRTIIDATGRAAVVTRLLGNRPRLEDKLVAVVREGTVPDDTETGVVVDAAPEGWWYSAPTSPGRRIWVWMTDSDLLRSQPAGDRTRWHQALAASKIMVSLARGARFDTWRIVPAMTQRAPAAAGSCAYLCVGDAASCFDPASSQGIVKALRSGLFAGYALYDCLIKGDKTAFDRHRDHVNAEYVAYKSQHRLHYDAQTRWSDSPFWSRRTGNALDHAEPTTDHRQDEPA